MPNPQQLPRMARNMALKGLAAQINTDGAGERQKLVEIAEIARDRRNRT